MNLLLCCGWAVASAGLLILEWKRPNRRRLLLRGAGTVCAVVSLGLLARHPPRHNFAETGPTEAALWTASRTRPAAVPSPPLVFALPGTASFAPASAVRMPDVGTLRRRFPNLRTLHLFGDGLDPAEVPALAGLRVVSHGPAHADGAAPAVVLLSCPREIPFGETLTASGRLAGLPPGGSLSLSLEAPDGRMAEASAGPADAQGEAGFDLRAGPLPAAGRYEWRLRAGTTDETLGISVVPPSLPRVLVLEDAPRFDTAALRRWYAAAGGTLTVRTRIGRDRFKYAGSGEGAPSFGAVDTSFLKSFDLVLADRQAVVALNEPETAALAAAITETGLGLLVRVDDAVQPVETASVPAAARRLLPWKLVAAPANAPADTRQARLHWAGQTVSARVPVPTGPFTLDLAPEELPMVDDGQGHPLVAARHDGSGQAALTLVNDTSRLLRENEPAAFAAYWSFLFSRLSRPRTDSPGRWTLGGGERGPVFVDHPLELRWSGPVAKSPGAVMVTQKIDDTVTPLAMAQDASSPGVWRGTFWPRSAGWYRVAAASGEGALDFWVDPAGAWPGLRAAVRRAVTTRFADETSAATFHPAKRISHAARDSSYVWFSLLVLAVGFLWVERRLSGPSFAG